MMVKVMYGRDPTTLHMQYSTGVYIKEPECISHDEVIDSFGKSMKVVD